MTLAALVLAVVTACSSEPASPLSQYRGKWLAINYWALWCKPCVKEIPELNALNESHKDIQVVGVNFDGVSDAELQTQIEQLAIDFPIIADPAAYLETPRPQVLPATLIINPQGELIDTLVGAQTESDLLRAMGKQP